MPQTLSSKFPIECGEAPTLCIAVIGATGELARGKIFPALFALYYSGFLPEVGLRWFSYHCLSGLLRALLLRNYHQTTVNMVLYKLKLDNIRKYIKDSVWPRMKLYKVVHFIKLKKVTFSVFLFLTAECKYLWLFKKGYDRWRSEIHNRFQFDLSCWASVCFLCHLKFHDMPSSFIFPCFSLHLLLKGLSFSCSKEYEF